MSDQTKEAAPDPDASAAAVTNDVAAREDEPSLQTVTKVEHGNGTAEGNAINCAEAAELVQQQVESAVNVQGDEDSSYRGGSTGSYPKRQSKSKYDPNAELIPEDAATRAQKIRNLADFYFSDSNLHTDAFLINLMEGQTNLPVKVEVIHKFNRMKKYEYADVVAALRESITLDVSGPQGLEEVRRKIPFDPKKDLRKPRTVYCKGFGDELPSSQFDIEAFFAQFGPTNSVRLRRADDKSFKGSCYIEFQDEETAQSFLALDPKPLWKGKHKLEIMSLAAYLDNKNKAIKNDEAEPNATRPFRSAGKGGRGGGYKGNRDRRDVGDRDPDDWKKRREDDQKSGFRDHKKDRDNRHHNGKGGRGRGRGNDRDRRNNDRNQDRDHRDRVKSDDRSNETKEKTVDIADKQEIGQKRTREDDDENDAAPSKRVDQKEEVTADAS